tara:strand:+ start:585 stop:2027 length:1443 start_codon:yes stop_codon:yes gene_type:complete
MNKLFCFIISLIISTTLTSQNESDVLRLSISDNLSTARVTALGGSFSSLGGNSGSILSNPATLASYRTNEFSASLSISNDEVESNYLNNRNNYDRLKINFQNISYVQSVPITNNDGWNRLNYSFTYNRRTDLNRKFSVGGYNSESSGANVFLSSAQGIVIDELESSDDYLAYMTYLIDTLNSTDNYISGVENIGQNQYSIIDEYGSIDDFDISIGSSYQDFIFLGASISFSSIDYTFQSRYLEDQFNSEQDLNSWTFNESLYVDGFGMNFKFGSIIKPTHFVRIGLAYHSRTYFDIDEFYETSMSTYFNNGDNFYEDNVHITSPYKINTPPKTIASLALVVAKKGLITFDLENIDYSKGNISSDYHSGFQQANNNISSYYSKTNNKKFGLEWKVKDFSLRSGYSVFGDPFRNNMNSLKREYISAGLGFQKNAYFFDFALVNLISSTKFVLYNDPTLSEISQIVDLESNRMSFIFSCSYKF